jgi:beta-1,4-mannosyl-glycoprotein beta-1,4-N-acetylglucosaminyltransferase
MKIIDCFTFFNELDLLEFRLKLLDEQVDHFVIAESNLTHSGQLKPFYFEENKARFDPWEQKIIYIPLKQTTDGLVFTNNEITYDPGSASWKLENEQRNSLAAANSIIGDDDLVLLSDLDEIPDPAILKKIKPGHEPVSLSQLFHYYFLNCQNIGNERWWNGTIASTGKQFKDLGPQQLRDKRNDYPRIKKAGWHFSYIGGLEKIKEKIRSFAHTEFNKEEYLSDNHILEAMEQGKDIFKRPGVHYKFFPLAYYPRYLKKVMLQYPALVHLKRKDNLCEKMYFGVKNKFR